MLLNQYEEWVLEMVYEHHLSLDEVAGEAGVDVGVIEEIFRSATAKIEQQDVATQNEQFDTAENNAAEAQDVLPQWQMDLYERENLELVLGKFNIEVIDPVVVGDWLFKNFSDAELQALYMRFVMNLEREEAASMVGAEPDELRAVYRGAEVRLSNPQTARSVEKLQEITSEYAPVYSKLDLEHFYLFENVNAEQMALYARAVIMPPIMVDIVCLHAEGHGFARIAENMGRSQTFVEMQYQKGIEALKNSAMATDGSTLREVEYPCRRPLPRAAELGRAG